MNSRHLLSGLAVALLCGVGPAAARITYIVSDLHLGVGRGVDSAWDPYEDFRWHESFAAFLDKLQELSPEGSALILNGDTFELWQSPEALVTAADAEQYRCPIADSAEQLGCEEAVARHRLARILEVIEHRATLRDLREFAERPGNQVVVVPGNHDAALLYPSVRQRLREVVGDKVEVATDGYWLSPDRRILVEHGHQMDPLNAMDNWPEPFIRHGGRSYLDRPWGESFVMLLFDPRERLYPIVDNVSGYGSAIGYLLQGETREANGALATVMGKLSVVNEAAGQLLRFMLFDTSTGQLVDVLGGAADPDADALGGTVIRPDWDVEAIRATNDPDLLRSLVPPGGENHDAAVFAVEWAIAQGGGLRDMRPDEIRVLCSAQWLRRQQAADGRRLCPATGHSDESLRAAGQALLSSPNDVLAAYLRQRREALSAPRRPTRTPANSDEPGFNESPFETYVYSHTHQPARGCSPMPRRDSWRPVVVNSGAWQRTASSAYINKKLGGVGPATHHHQGAAPDPFRAFRARPEDLEPCYAVVAIAAGRERDPRVMFWVEDPSGKRGLRATCPKDQCLLDHRQECDPDTDLREPTPKPDTLCGG